MRIRSKKIVICIQYSFHPQSKVSMMVFINDLLELVEFISRQSIENIYLPMLAKENPSITSTFEGAVL